MIISSQLKILTMITTSTPLKKVTPGFLSRKKLFFILIIAVSATQAFGQANTALSNLSSPAVNVNLLPGTDNSKDLGSSTKSWKDFYVDGVIYRQGDPWIAGNFTSFSTFVGQNAGFNCLNQSNSENNTFIGASAGYSTTTGT